MGRRRKYSTADDRMDFVALLPWWVCVGLTATSYWLLHGVAMRTLPAAQSGRQVGEALPLMLPQGLSTTSQYMIPFIGLLRALASFVHRQKRSALFDQDSRATGANVLQGIGWKKLEMLAGEGFGCCGYGMRETRGGGTNGGVAFLLTQGGEKLFAQHKQLEVLTAGVARQSVVDEQPYWFVPRRSTGEAHPNAAAFRLRSGL